MSRIQLKKKTSNNKVLKKRTSNKKELKTTQLSVNINKIATLRNARAKNVPNLCYFAQIVLESQAGGLTLHPRPDERHIRYQDVHDIKKLLKKYPQKEFNIEGYPSASFLDLIKKIKPHQCTLVPDPPDAMTSNAGWDFVKNKNLLKTVVKKLKKQQVRSSLFLDPLKWNSLQYQALTEIKPDRVEFYTESYAESFKNPLQKKQILSKYKKCLKTLEKANIKINAGHDLNQKNLGDLLKSLPQIKEVSIGQALISESLEKGLASTIQSYLKITQGLK